MGNTIKISDRMAEALIHALDLDGEKRLNPNVQVATTVALMNRGLARYDAKASRENGYTIHVLTARGLWVRGYLEGNPEGREFLTSMVDRAVHKAEPVTEDNSVAAVTQRIVAETPAVTEYSVKIWYRSGAYEGVAHSPEELARKIFADAVKSAGVEFAELHGPSGKLVESKAPARCDAANYSDHCELSPGHAGRHRDGNSSWPNRGRLVSQHGEDLTAAYSPPGTGGADSLTQAP